MSFPQPSHRDDFEVAIVCALKAEFDAISLVIDEFWDNRNDPYGKAMGDTNSYRTGRIGKHNVALLQLRQMGKAHAAAAAASLRSSFNRLRLVLLVGGCAAVPQRKNANIVLGDIIISTGIVQYDFGRKFPDQFIRKDTPQDNLVKPCKEIGNVITALQTSDVTNHLLKRTATLLTDLQKNARDKGYGTRYEYPGVYEDKLFKSDFHHKHHNLECRVCGMTDDSICDTALGTTCEDLGCEEKGLVTGRQRIEEKLKLCQDGDIAHQNPNIFFGLVGSGDTVMKSGCDRDKLAAAEDILAFEMEAAGLWEDVPSLVVKSVFDYGDSHKNKKWHHFSSATAACAARAIIERLPRTGECSLSVPTVGKRLVCFLRLFFFLFFLLLFLPSFTFYQFKEQPGS
jgi:nucleoside phosphorylase